jgi:hypothetical protein
VSGAGYSGTPLAQKLGVKPGMRAVAIGAPDSFGLDGVAAVARVPRSADLIVFFTDARARLERSVDALGRAVHPAGSIWVAWPKRASKVPTDMTEDVVRAVVLPRGLVDVKVCAIDDTWSGLKVVWRTERRAAD